MHHVSNFALQYNDVDFDALYASPYDLIVTEGDPVPAGTPHPAISAAHVAALRAQGRTVIGYVETSIVEDYRSYWDKSWTKDGTSTGKLTDAAPDWLKGQPKNSFGYITKYWDPAWQAIVVKQAVYLVKHGYDGVFLDDVGRYYDLIGADGQPGKHALADAMIDLVAKVTAAIKAVDPDAYVVVNGDPYIGDDATGGQHGAEMMKFLASFDTLLLENENDATLADAITNVGAGKLIALYSAGSDAHKLNELLHAYKLGVMAYISPDQAYNKLGDYVNPGTSGDDHLTGGDGPNQLNGLGGNDVIKGGAGDDVLTGGKGADVLTGGKGADTFVYANAAQSTNARFDALIGFDAAVNKIDTTFAVTSIDAKIAHGKLTAAHFVHDLMTATASLGAHHALLFTPDSGAHAGENFLIVDANGEAGYQSGQDLVLRLQDAHHLTAFDGANFI
jgi:uncharacterized protein (TIGR01370 family)